MNIFYIKDKEATAIANIYRTVITITLFSTVDQIGGFIYTIILSHAIGAEGLGMYQVASNLVSLIVALSASGLPFVLGRRVAEFDALGDKKSQNGAVTAALAIGMGISICMCGIFFLNNGLLIKLTQSSQIATMCLLLLPAAFANSLYACFRGALWGKKKYVPHSSLEIIDIVIRICLALVVFQGFFSEYTGTLRACMAYSATCIITATVSFITYKIHGGGFAKPAEHIKPIIKSAIPVSGIRLAGSLFTTAIAVLFNMRMTAVGYTLNSVMAEYGILTGMVLPLIAFPVIFTYAISTTLVPEISGNMKIGKVEIVRRHLKKAINYTLLFGALAIGVYIAFAPDICMLVFKNAQAGKYVQNACWIMIPLAVASLTTSLQNSLGLEYKSLLNYFVGGLCMILSLWFLPKYIGSYCLIVGTGLGMGVTAVLNTTMICKTVQLKGNFIKTMFTLLLFAAISGAMGLLLSNLCTVIVGGIFALIICCIICVGVFLTLVTMFDTAEISLLWKNLLILRGGKNAAKQKIKPSCR